MPNKHKGYKPTEARDMTNKIRTMRLLYRRSLNNSAGQAFDNLQRFIKSLEPAMTATEVPSMNRLIITDGKTGHIELFRMCEVCQEYKIVNAAPEWQVQCFDCMEVMRLERLRVSAEAIVLKKDLTDIEEDSESELDVWLTFRKSNSLYV